MNPDTPETQPAFETAEPKPKLPLLLKLAIISSAISLFCSIVIIVMFHPPFLLDFTVTIALFHIAVGAGVVSVVLYIGAATAVRGRQLLAFGMGLASFCILMVFGLQAIRTLQDNAYTAHCQINLKSIRTAINRYSQTHHGLSPDPNWCDTILKADTRLSQRDFVCKATDARYDRNESSYALNKNLIERKLSDVNPDTVMLFETKTGWNQIGDANAVALNHHSSSNIFRRRTDWNKIDDINMVLLNRYPGCNILFINGRIRFIPENKIPKLRWNP